FVPFFFILSLRQAGHLISRVIRISLFYQNPTCFFSAYFLKHHPTLDQVKSFESIKDCFIQSVSKLNFKKPHNLGLFLFIEFSKDECRYF
ncbi:hypothetical protein, partial [Acinetobacter sp. YH01024]|uniref:hypothetical protein n=1 Tax=Acinetobacter sp. YH01024 TaxID=2601037 RepID=UPI001C55090A